MCPARPRLAASHACRRFHDLAVEMPGRMRENGHHDRETGKHQQETDGQGPATISPQRAIVNGFTGTALMDSWLSYRLLGFFYSGLHQPGARRVG